MFSFKRKRDGDVFEETPDVLIVFDNEAKTSDIKRINDISEDSVIVTGQYKVPLEDCEITNSIEGRHFFYRAPSQSITETKRLAQLEKNIVLNQITSYRDHYAEQGTDFTKIGLLVIIAIAFLMFGVSSCTGV
ncbi:hypothetical protein [Desertibacillus haloalkaliphilus]|uniref:hypothetical protein n=1 Tax=Desertibacillus haloalkaliphilus TaxID=1328930 RepID=UPI001C26DF0D|nr:hypothetical protein [Desertibacillus haloalkaliphilus]MBU8905580.1 hypothetical protein [Desertibacillus haloalkaliphilus]